ncbi:hypothetical protein GNI_160630 [Gregarina niphandrodes]|uniref:Uncharacterized protein n=1 Tax=Gregarina niphandrodes TaxID=110365 RepID=A0A023AYJ8_GRENI|nr:hypothetical protein GNI_160630 [Gregarina niphandrodes]EZG43736.1 hypothetical protein GNI_160630 [Gregarina niphandrodes]|eukprot:XP_011133023.1 hypothetical protein GNI_160630 [Gregarina niphandrodes]
MRGLSSNISVDTRVLLSSAVITFEVNDMPVDMVKAFRSLEPWDPLSQATRSCFNLLEQVPEMEAGLPAAEHVELSTGELIALHNAVRVNQDLLRNVLLSGCACLLAVHQVILTHPKTCGASAELRKTIAAWAGGARCPTPATKANKIKKLKFFLLSLTRFFETDDKHVTVPRYQPCNPGAVLRGAWKDAKAKLDLEGRLSAGKIMVDAATVDEYRARMGTLALPISN